MLSAAFIWGIMLGLGSSLHCAGMCGPIGCSLLLMGDGRERPMALALRLGAMQLGRIAAYGGLGLGFGLIGTGLYLRADFSGVHGIMQWSAAALMIWIGLGTAGLVPSFAGLDRLAVPLAGRLARLRAGISAAGPETGLLAGLIWGLTPCAMVYAAAFTSLLTGSVEDGVVLMLAFGLGTVPAVIASSLAFYRASRMGSRPGRKWAGAMQAGAGVLALLLTVPGSPLCITGA